MFLNIFYFVLLEILEDEIQVDSYVAVPAIMPKLIPLRNKLRRKYPSTKRSKKHFYFFLIDLSTGTRLTLEVIFFFYEDI